MTRILIVEDNQNLARGLSRSLETEGYDVDRLARGDEALDHVHEHTPDLVVLDLMLPGRDGFHVLRDLRDAGFDMPVLILSARSQEVDKVQGFRLGADDYVVKPVGVLELLARVEAILRRARGGTGAADAYTFGENRVDVRTRTVTHAGEPVELSRIEFDLVLCLLEHDGAVVDRETLLRDVWGYKVPIETRTIDTHIANLRAKLEADPSDPQHILTVRKVGYRLER